MVSLYFLGNDRLGQKTIIVCGNSQVLLHIPSPVRCRSHSFFLTLSSKPAISAMYTSQAAAISGAVLVEARSTDLRRLRREGFPERS